MGWLFFPLVAFVGILYEQNSIFAQVRCLGKGVRDLPFFMAMEHHHPMSRIDFPLFFQICQYFLGKLVFCSFSLNQSIQPRDNAATSSLHIAGDTSCQ
jgi:hypothetical protein